MPSGCKDWDRERAIRHSIPGWWNGWTPQTRTLVGESCERNDAGDHALTHEDKMKAWVWAPCYTVQCRIWVAKQRVPWGARDPDPQSTQAKWNSARLLASGIVAEIFNAAGEEGVELAWQMTGTTFSYGVIPSDWEESFIMNLYKDNGEALDHGNYRGLKLTDQVIKLLESVLDYYTREMVNIDEMQFGFVPGRGIIDAVFVVRQLQDKYTHCSSSWCWRRSRMGSPLVCRESFSTLITWCLSRTPRRSVSSSSQIHYYRNLALRTLHRSFAVGDSDYMATYSGSRLVSTLSQTCEWQPQGMAHGQHLNIKWIWMDICNISMCLHAKEKIYSILSNLQTHYLLTHCDREDLWKWAIFNTILTSPKSWLSQEDSDAGCEHSLVPMDS